MRGIKVMAEPIKTSCASVRPVQGGVVCTRERRGKVAIEQDEVELVRICGFFVCLGSGAMGQGSMSAQMLYDAFTPSPRISNTLMKMLSYDGNLPRDSIQRLPRPT